MLASDVKKVNEDINTLVALTQMAIMGSEQEIELLRDLLQSDLSRNIKAYLSWLLGDDFAFSKISESAQSWFENIARSQSVRMVYLSGSVNDKYFPNFQLQNVDKDVLIRAMRIGKWPTSIEGMYGYSFDDIEVSIDTHEELADFSYLPSLNFICQNLDLIEGMATSDDPELLRKLPHSEENQDIIRAFANLFEYAFLTKFNLPFEMGGENLTRFLINWAKFTGYVSYNSFWVMTRNQVEFESDQIVKLLYVGYHFLANDLGRRLVRLPKELRVYTHTSVDDSQVKVFNTTVQNCRNNWVSGVVSAAEEILIKKNVLTRGGFISQSEIKCIEYDFGYRLRPVIHYALLSLISKFGIRIYQEDSPFDSWKKMSAEELRAIPKPKYAEAADFVTDYKA